MSAEPVGAWLARIDALLARHPAPPVSRLEAERLAAAANVKAIHLRALERMGVARATLAEFSRDRGFGLITASEHPSEPGLYCLDPDGAPHLVLPIVEDGELVDLCAFRSADPTRWLLRSGLGWALGVEQGLERHTWLLHGEAVPLAVSPLEWLQQGCRGLCVLDWDAPEVRHLVDVPRLRCSTDAQAKLLRSALSRPVRFPDIIVEEARLVA